MLFKKVFLFGIILLFQLGAFAQPQTVTGTVTDSQTGESMPGVNIVVKGTTLGAITDSEGKYSISVTARDAVLIFTFIGYRTIEIPVEQRSVIDVALESEVLGLEEVVVVGYTSKRLSELSSSVSTVSSKRLQDVTSDRVESMLQGKAPGVIVSSSSGNPNATPSIIIRGSSSITAGSDPLYVVDGIIGGTANPQDIESITILKDAAATGLYGSRASNGVIIITTKKGKSGRTQINFSSTVGYNKVSEGNYKVMNSQQLYDYQKTFWNPATWDVDRPSSLLSQDTDWHDLLFNTGITQNYILSISGGSDKTQIYVSGNYYNEKGTLGPNNHEAFNLRSNIFHNINDRLKLSVKLNGRTEKREDEAAGSNFLTSHENMPWDNPYNPDGSLKMGTEEGWIGRDNDNFLHGWQYNFDLANRFSFIGDITLDYYIAKGLTFSSNNRANFSNQKRQLYYDIRAKAGAGVGKLTDSFSNNKSFITSNRLQYQKTFGKNEFQAIAVAEAEYNYTDNNSTSANGFAPGLNVMSVASSIVSASGSTGENAFNKGLVQVDYDFDKRYFFVGSFIRESSSRFGANNRSANFFTLGTSYIISNESYMENQQIFDLLKIRVSYGLVGNAQINNYQSLGLYSFAIQYAGNSGSDPSQVANNDLTWEKTGITNFGLDVGIFKRISLNMDLYQKATKALLLSVEVPYTTGFATAMRNVGSVRNRGLELNLNTINLDGELKWETNFNVAFNKNKVITLDKGKDILQGGTGSTPGRIIRVGQDLNSWYLRKWAGVDPTNGNPLWEKVTTDINGETTISTTNVYSDASLQIAGKFTPKFTGGINNIITYKNLSLSAFFNFVSSVMIYKTLEFVVDSDGAYDTENQRVLSSSESRWETPGDIVTHPKPIYGGNLNSNRASSRYLQDGSYIRLRNVKLAYEIPVKLLSRINIANASLFVSGDNLLTITQFTGKDPETDLSGGGGEAANYPISKKILFGINIGL